MQVGHVIIISNPVSFIGAPGISQSSNHGGESPLLDARYVGFHSGRHLSGGVPACYHGARLLSYLLADTITREVDVIGTCEFLSINNMGVLARSLAAIGSAVHQGSNRTDFENYDIENAAERLKAWYVAAYGEVRNES